MYTPDPDRIHKARLAELRVRSSCVRRQVAALAIHIRTGRVVAEGWNMERDGLCKTDCPRAKTNAKAGVSNYQTGPTRCIAIHAEEMLVRALRAQGIRPKEVEVLVSEEPCYMCSAMLQKIKISWRVLPLPSSR